MPKSNDAEEKLKKRREQKKLSMRRARLKLRENKEQHELIKKQDRERYRKKKEAGLTKSIKDLSRRDQKALRKEWRARARRSRQSRKLQADLQKRLEENSPPPSPASVLEGVNPTPPTSRNSTPSTSRNSNPVSTSRAASGRRVARKNRYKWKREKTDLLNKIEALQTAKNKYKTRYHRLRKKITKTQLSTPEKKLSETLLGQEVPPSVKKNLLFGEVLKNQIKKNYGIQSTLKEKHMFGKVLHGSVIKKFKFQKELQTLTSRRVTSLSLRTKNKETIRKKLKARSAVTKFLENDENSRMTSGKKETITRKKIKKQIRYLNDNLKKLHTKFVATTPNFSNMSYSTFCSLRPFWIRIPNYKSRNTCLCRIHANMSLLVTKLKNEKMINEYSGWELAKSMCCLKDTGACWERTCEGCSSKIIKYNSFNAEDTTFYEKWISKKVNIIIKGIETQRVKTVKEKFECSKAELVDQLTSTIDEYMRHCNIVMHQHREATNIKQNIKNNEVLIHLDFSENYECKYAEEIQSAHFGGSKPQITLHTVVMYYLGGHVCYCTLAQSLQHDPVSICAHLDPIIEDVKDIVPNLDSVYFLSDGPSTQYKNKTMFRLAVWYLASRLNVMSLYWNYSASGHGKGAPDGVGGCVKRTADALVSHNKDINNFDKLYEALQENCKGIRISKINEDFSEIAALVTNLKILPFKGTTQIHQLCWSRSNPSELQARRLSCNTCKSDQYCQRFGIGIISVEQTNNMTRNRRKLTVSEVYTSGSSESSSESEENISLQSLKLQIQSTFMCYNTVKLNNYVVARICGRKSEKQYIGLVIDKTQNDLQLKFLKKSGNKFVFPEIDDIAYIDYADVMKILSEPSVNKRQHYFFDDVSNINNLF